MLRHSSTIKRARQNKKIRLRNRKVKLEMKNAVKDMKKSETQENLREAYSAIDLARKKGVIHLNTAARKKSKLANSVKEKAKKEPKKEPSITKPKVTKPKTTKPKATKTTKK